MKFKKVYKNVKMKSGQIIRIPVMIPISSQDNEARLGMPTLQQEVKSQE